MKVEKLGKITELPSVPNNLITNILLLEDKKDKRHNIFTSNEDLNGNMVWLDMYKPSVIDPRFFKQAYLNGAEALLITLEIED